MEHGESSSNLESLRQPIWFNPIEDNAYPISSTTSKTTSDSIRRTKIICTLGAHTSTIVFLIFTYGIGGNREIA